MSNEPNAPVQPTIPGPLPFTHSKRDVAKTLKSFMDNAAWLVGFTREKAPGYTVDWRKRHNLMEIKPPEDTPDDRAQWFRTILGTSLAYGMDLPTSSNPNPDELVWAVARWAHGALLHIQGLERAHQRAISEWAASDLRQQQEYETLLKALEEQRKRTATLDALLTSAHAVIDQHVQEGDRLRASLRKAEEDRIEAARERAREFQDMHTNLAHEQELRRSADSARDAWESSAKSSQDALALLKAALRIPTGPVEAPDVAGGDGVALVRR